MFVDGFGEIITDILTVNPGLSAVNQHFLDASNYTFQAVTLGKDAAGYNFHAHSPSTTHLEYTDGVEASGVSGATFNTIDSLEQVVVGMNFKNSGNYVSSYLPSATQLHFIDTYNSLAGYPSPEHTRLEQKSTLTTNASSFSATLPDLGHYPNAYMDSSVSSAWNVLGGYAPPAEDGRIFVLVNRGGGHIASGILSGIYNKNKVVDKNGFIKVSQTSALAKTDVLANLVDGCVVFSSLSDGIDPMASSTAVAIVPQQGDAVTLAMFGGVNHIGVYCIDVKAMLAASIDPPYSWNPINNVRVGNELNNKRIYKLVSKATFWDNLMIHSDDGFTGHVEAGEGGLQRGYNMGSLTNKGPTFIVKFNFL